MTSRRASYSSRVEVDESVDSELARALEAYLAAAEAGRAIDLERLAAEHPAVADQLRSCLGILRLAAKVEGDAQSEPSSGSEYRPPPEMQLGDFQLLRPIGRGGMGIVYEAEQISLHRRVALKVLPFAAALDHHQLRRFQIEAQAAAQLHHTNIVPVFAVGCEHGVHYYAMQFIDGQTLAQVIAERREMASPLPRGGTQPPLQSQLQAVPGPAEAGPLTASPLGARWLSPHEGESQRDGGKAGEGEVLELRAEAESGPAQAGTPTPAGRGSPDPAHDGTEGILPCARVHAGPGQAQGGTLTSTPTPRSSSSRDRRYFRHVTDLGIQAAEALDHAHKVGIVHRDIKPANLLLDTHGRLWITDFGLARLQTETGLTMTGDVIGTLRYMSPEQALAKRMVIDHRADIYSLGATLYELLTLHSAIDGRDRQEILRKIAQDEPTPPRKHNPSIPRELETIVLKAMSKEPESRYATAHELAEDLERFLEQKPIRARRPSLPERLAKWVARHRGVTVATAILLLLTILGLATEVVIVARERDAARRERERAMANLGLARQAVDAMLTEVGQTTLANVPQMSRVRRSLLERARAFYQLFLERNGDNPAVRFEAALAHQRVGNIERLLGRFDRAEAAYRLSIAMIDGLIAVRRAPADAVRQLAESERALGSMLDLLGRTSEAEAPLRRAVALVSPLPDVEARRVLATAYVDLGKVAWRSGRLAVHESENVRAREILERLVAESPNSARDLSILGGVLNNLGNAAAGRGNFDEARVLLEAAVARQSDALRAEPDSTDVRASLQKHQGNLPRVYFALGRFGDAERAARAALASAEGLAADFPAAPRYQQSISSSLTNLANVLRAAGKLADAERATRRAIAILERLADDNPSVPVYREDLAGAVSNLGGLAETAGRVDEAARTLRRALALLEALSPSSQARPDLSGRWVVVTDQLAHLLADGPDAKLRDPEEAIKLARNALGREPQDSRVRAALGVALYRAGAAQEAIAALEEASRGKPGLPGSDVFILCMAYQRAGALAKAQLCYDRGLKEIQAGRAIGERAERLRSEAAVVLGLAVPQLPNGPDAFSKPDLKGAAVPSEPQP